MTNLREAAQMALRALQESKPIDIDDPAAFYRSAHAIEALRAALAQPEQEPVAWMHEWNGDVQINNLPAECYGEHWTRTPLYTAPPQREWQGLTDEEKYLNEARSAKEIEYAKAIEAKLKKKNA